jgi:hypothetical protein
MIDAIIERLPRERLAPYIARSTVVSACSFVARPRTVTPTLAAVDTFALPTRAGRRTSSSTMLFATCDACTAPVFGRRMANSSPPGSRYPRHVTEHSVASGTARVSAERAPAAEGTGEPPTDLPSVKSFPVAQRRNPLSRRRRLQSSGVNDSALAVSSASVSI